MFMKTSYFDNDRQQIVIQSNTKKEWFKNNNLHRDNDKPAIVYADGSKYWYKNGKLHREEDKPAVVLTNGTMVWYKNGNHHRENNPAVIISESHSNEKLYHLNGEKVMLEKHYWIRLLLMEY